MLQIEAKPLQTATCLLLKTYRNLPMPDAYQEISYYYYEVTVLKPTLKADVYIVTQNLI